MELADEIKGLRDRALTDLNAAHDYFTRTAAAWDIVRKVIRAGYTFTMHSPVTGTITTQAELLDNANLYVAQQSEGFLRPENRALVLAGATVEEVLGLLAAYRPVQVEK